MPNNSIVWLDLETTGLDPQKDRILEVGIIITDKRLDEVARSSWVLHTPSGVLGELDPKVVKMHANSGLWEECLKSEFGLQRVSQEVLAFLREYRCEGAYLAGNSVGDFDRHFLRNHLSAVNELLSHRSINVSTFKALFSLWAPQVKPSVPEKGIAHRSLADCEGSIRELKFWLSNMHELNGAEVLVPRG